MKAAHVPKQNALPLVKEVSIPKGIGSAMASYCNIRWIR
jgi:hypothetical protein